MLVFLFTVASAIMALPVPNAALDCSTCQFENQFIESNGYYCFQLNDGNVACTCPDQHYTINRPCRICERKDVCGDNPKNICAETSPDSLRVQSNNTQYFACFCEDLSFVVGKPCPPTLTSVAIPTITPAMPAN